MMPEAERVRRMISTLQADGMSNSDIGRAVGVSADVIGRIARGALKGDPDPKVAEGVEALHAGKHQPKVVTARFAPGCSPRYGR